MNVQYTHRGINFEWDSNKDTSNRTKHRISFESACEAFFDPMLLLVTEEVVDDELREHLIGMTIS